MPIPIPQDATEEQILKLIRANGGGFGGVQQVTQPQPSGGSVTMPSVLPAQGNDPVYGPPNPNAAPAQTPNGNFGRGPVLNSYPATPLSAPDANPSLSSYLASKFGATTPSLFSQTGGDSAASSMTSGRGGAGGGLNSILSALTAGYEAPRKELAKFGKGYQNEINQNFKQDSAKQEQDAISRGLGNTTIRASLLGGARRRQQDASLNLQDRLASARAGLLERQMPSSLQASELLSQATQGAYGSGNTLSSIQNALGLR